MVPAPQTSLSTEHAACLKASKLMKAEGQTADFQQSFFRPKGDLKEGRGVLGVLGRTTDWS